jgi:flagellar assembly factor FliW
MEVRTTRFGTVDIAEERVITFPRGLLGFAEHKRYCLLEPAEDSCFFWLQSLDEPALAFVVTDPSFFVLDYTVPIRPEQMAELHLPEGERGLADAQVFVIVNKVDQTLTGNLQGPLVINTVTHEGEQLVLAEKRWTTRHELVKLARAGGRQDERTTAAALSA